MCDKGEGKDEIDACVSLVNVFCINNPFVVINICMYLSGLLQITLITNQYPVHITLHSKECAELKFVMLDA
jgi:hypothetical protein